METFSETTFTGLFQLIVVVVLGVMIYLIIKNIGLWNENNHASSQNVVAKVITKRTKVTQHQQPNAGDPTGTQGFSTVTSAVYYVTFQTESGEKKEFTVNRPEYERLIEGNMGLLSFKGTRYLGFKQI